MKVFAQCVLGVVVLAACSLMNAGTLGVATTPDPANVFVNTGIWTLGYSFQVETSIYAVALGVYDHNSDGLNVSHDVGLWDSSENLLASTTVGAGTVGSLNAGYRFSSIAPLLLAAGSVYYVGSVNGEDSDEWLQDPATLVAAPEITYLSRRYESSGGGLVFPAQAGSGTTGYFGGNFEFEATNVPEPWTIALTAIGFVALGLLRRRSS